MVPSQFPWGEGIFFNRDSPDELGSGGSCSDFLDCLEVPTLDKGDFRHNRLLHGVRGSVWPFCVAFGPTPPIGCRYARDPVVQRYRGKVTRIYFRADAAFAMPEVYEVARSGRKRARNRSELCLGPKLFNSETCPARSRRLSS
jgi:hypothetical protein